MERIRPRSIRRFSSPRPGRGAGQGLRLLLLVVATTLGVLIAMAKDINVISTAIQVEQMDPYGGRHEMGSEDTVQDLRARARDLPVS